MESAMPRSTVHANGRTTIIPKKVMHACTALAARHDAGVDGELRRERYREG